MKENVTTVHNTYDFPILGFLQLLRFLGQPCSHLLEESLTAPDIYLLCVETMTGKPFNNWKVLLADICSGF